MNRITYTDQHIDEETRKLKYKELHQDKDINGLKYTSKYLKKIINEKDSLPKILFELEKLEIELRSIEENIVNETNPRMDEIGFIIRRTSVSEFVFNERTDNIGEAGTIKEVKWLEDDEQTKYKRKYKEKIEKIEQLDGFYRLLEIERDYYNEKLMNFTIILNDEVTKTTRLNWFGTFTDFAFLIDKLIKKGLLRKGYKDILKHFYIEGEEKTERQLTDLISKINNIYRDNRQSSDIDSIVNDITVDKK
jgi:hypothetical protein